MEVTTPRILTPQEKDVEQIIITEEACKKLVAEYTAKKPIVFQNIIVGQIDKLIYDETTKRVIAIIDLWFNLAGAIEQNLSTFLQVPEGKRALSIALEAGILMPDFQKIEEFVKKKGE